MCVSLAPTVKAVGIISAKVNGGIVRVVVSRAIPVVMDVRRARVDIGFMGLFNPVDVLLYRISCCLLE